jgi:hypothetical protein
MANCESGGYDFVEGDTLSKLRVVCRDAQTEEPIPLTGFTVKLGWRKADGTLVDPLQIMTQVDSPQGVTEYQFGPGELYAGVMEFEVSLWDSNGKLVKSLDLVRKRVRRKLA